MKIEIEKFLKESIDSPVIDVRSPAEYQHAHIPGAINIELLSNEERAIVGTLYKQKGKDKAFLKALELVGPNMADFVRKAKKISNKYKTNKLLIYCWRGGMRSGSMSWLFDSAGFETKTLEGGYKAYRNYMQKSFDNDQKIIVLGGYTGSGKTEILQELNKQNQVIDLENLANHKGSAFGFIGQEKQPSTEYFENKLGLQWLDLDKNKAIWLEDESRNIGSVYLPENLYQKIRQSTVIFIDVPKKYRIKRLVAEYSNTNIKHLKFALDKIKKRIGGLNYKNSIEALDNKDFATVVDIVLDYYDKAYLHGINKRKKNTIHKIKIDNDTPKNTAMIISNYLNSKIKLF